MPLELGIFLGAKRFGDKAQKLKRALILDTHQHRYQQFISDLAGMDPKPHGGDPRRMVTGVRDWLLTVSARATIPAPMPLLASYDRFVEALPTAAERAGLDVARIEYPDFERLTLAWIDRDGQSHTP
ncbi:MAG: hypothetical protein Q7U20_08145 [Caulobacter sp.]|nr:hypothetical protein [Caulobacter sp.]